MSSSSASGPGLARRLGTADAELAAAYPTSGVGQTTLAMARDDDLPGWLAAVHPRYLVAHHAEIALALVVCLLVLVADLRGAIGFSSFGVLLYYLIANVSAFTQTGDQRRYPRWLQVLGAVGCAVLVSTLPVQSVLAGAGVFAVGIAYRAWRVRAAVRPPPERMCPVLPIPLRPWVESQWRSPTRRADGPTEQDAPA